LLVHNAQLPAAHAPAAVLLGQVHAHEPGLADGLPQLGGLLAGPGLGREVVVTVVGGDLGHGLAEHDLLGRLTEVHRHPPWVSSSSAGSSTTLARSHASRPLAISSDTDRDAH